MSLNSTELEEHCQTILKSARIKNKVVILCEGTIDYLKGRRSPSSYRTMEVMPDANFYKACVPEIWKQKKPAFFNCGDRNDVINTYFKLKELHQDPSNSSRLTPDKLFAFIDLDLHVQQIENYAFADTEEIFNDIYQDFQLREEVISRNRILTTGLIYKEAYFLLPDLQDFFMNSPITVIGHKPCYKNKLLNLSNLYQDIINNLEHDLNLQTQIEIAANRLEFCEGINCTSIQKFQESLHHQYQSNWASYAYPLFLVSQVKKYWEGNEDLEGLVPEEDYPGEVQQWREDLSLTIGREVYAKSSDPKHHIPALLREIYNHFYGQQN